MYNGVGVYPGLCVIDFYLGTTFPDTPLSVVVEEVCNQLQRKQLMSLTYAAPIRVDKRILPDQTVFGVAFCQQVNGAGGYRLVLIDNAMDSDSQAKLILYDSIPAKKLVPAVDVTVLVSKGRYITVKLYPGVDTAAALQRAIYVDSIHKKGLVNGQA